MLNKYKGFINLGNTCYLNAGLQLIMQNIELCELLKQTNLCNFVEEYYNPSNTAISPNQIKDLVSEKCHIFRGFKQQDSQEFIINLLDIINEQIKINTLFEIHQEITIKCKLLKCLNKSTHIEKHNFLLLNINKENKSLDDCFREYKKREKLNDDNMYFCEKCNAKRIASKRLKIIHYPKHLIIMIKRFNQNMSKNNQTIDVPLEWRNNYKLQGIVFHSGSAYGGHYIYIGKNNNQWYMFNDDSVSKINENQLDHFKNNAYILYYIKKSL